MQLHYKIEGIVETLSIPERPLSRSQWTLTPFKLYNGPLSVLVPMLKDMLKLIKKLIIPRLYSDEYLTLNGSEDVADVLAETDEEDYVQDEIINEE